ncbi:hypothetical protein BDW59DRAFT_178695 [Aspergillus cavernicola]|uniref:SWIM-type domain-containing protein n=1 Tax=Aspergillus cavernicola TaxID=176166 RepID=A0ABR4ILY5_9EURO
MSAPTGQFGALSIRGDRERSAGSETASARRERERDRAINTNTNTARGREMADDDMSAVRSSSGLVYDVALSGLDLETRSRALLALTTEFEVLFCGPSRTGARYEFVLEERVRVHICLDDDDDAEGRYTCSCAVFRGASDVACQHIFWLLDQLQAQFVSPPIPLKILLSSNGHAQGFTRVEQLLSDPPLLETIAKRLNWPYIRSPAEGGLSRTQRVRDILSAFTTDILPEEFRLDLVDEEDEEERLGRVSPSQRTPEQCVVQSDFEATAFRLAVHDDNVFASLCKAMPPGACAAIYFDKVLKRSRTLLSNFDQYCQTYEHPRKATASGSLDVHIVLEDLRTHVRSIQQNIMSRTPHGIQGALKVLITLLEEISNRNKDALDVNRHGRTSFANEDEDHRNLWHQLIGKTEETGNYYFILNTLENLSAEDLHQFKDRLRNILHKNEVHRAPRGYILKLGAIVRAAEAGETNTTSTNLGRKRSAKGEGAEGAPKRLR